MEEVVQERQAPSKGGGALTVIGAMLCILFGFLLICNLTIIIKGTLFPEKPPSVLGVTPMVVLSGSMSGQAEDHIEVGDLIFVGKAEAEALEMAYRAMSEGARGVDMGRNIFQSEHPAAMCRAVAAIVHRGFDAKRAYEYYLELANE